MHAVFKRELGCTPRAWQDRALAAAGAPADSHPSDVAGLHDDD
jgi:AraC-like DNA-binding protein